jgi:hypothetical protein
MTAIVITPSLATSWVRPLATLRGRGVGCVAVTFDMDAFERYAREEEARLQRLPPYEPDPAAVQARAKRARALRHALAEYEVPTYTVTPARALGEVLIG